MTNKQPIRILIVDDHEMVRRGLGMFLRGFDDLLLVGEATNGDEAVQLCAEVMPDVILMDIVMPGTNGIEATRQICKQYPDIYIIALTSSSDPETVTAAIQAGANSYLLKNISDDQLANAIRTTRNGEHVLASEATEVLINTASIALPASYKLTDRELEILTHLVQGLSNSEIAEQLFVSKATVKYHLTKLFSKLEVTNRSEAIVLALEHHLV